ncbi:MAG: HAD-IIA family hydrolase [Acetatifactor sp.]|nr:HAD-IIA family hydrolase [Acetatifactor sp.]
MTTLSEKKLFLFDIDGTIAVGDTLYEGSRPLLDYIQSIGGKAYYITNNSTRSNADYVKKFRAAFGLETTVNQFITSGYMTLRFLQRHYSQDKIYVLGTASYIAELRKNGLTVTEEPESDAACVVVAYDSELTYQKLVNACRLLSVADVPFYGTNPDLCCPIDFGFIPDCGAICQMITASTGKTPCYLGKPNPEVVTLCQADSGFTAAQTLVVGDRLYTDIACGINAGVDTCVLYTGEATPEEVAHTQYKPTYAFANVQALLDACRPAP